MLILLLLSVGFAPVPALAQRARAETEGTVQLDFDDVELAEVIDSIAKLTNRNFIYDDRVRGRVTIISPTEVSIDQAYAVFEAVLKVKGFTAIDGPGNVTKVVPIRDASVSSIDTIKDGRPSRNRDKFVTRLVPLQYIGAESITNTIKPLVSKDASMVAYEPTNTIILTDTESNIRRLLSILEAIDVESYREELAVIKIKHADAATLGDQISEIYSVDASATGGNRTAAARRAAATRRTGSRAAAQPAAGGSPSAKVRIITDERTNSIMVLASRQQIEDIRGLVRKIDVKVDGEGKIRVYYLRHADAEEMATTLNNLLSGQRSSGSPRRSGAASPAAAGGATPQALRSAVTELSEGVTLTADAATNSLVIQASKEAYETLVKVIEKLDISRPQVLVEALILEVDVNDSLALGVGATLRLVNGDTDLLFSTVLPFVAPGVAPVIGQLFTTNNGLTPGNIEDGQVTDNGATVGVNVQAAAGDGKVNIVSAPHILTSDNEEAEIRIGDNIPIITGRTNAATGGDSLSQSVNVERRDVGVTLRVTPQISEGDTVRLDIFQELTKVTDDIDTGDPEQVGVALRNRRVENTVVVNDGETVVIGGLIDDQEDVKESKIPFLGDIPVLGWLFKTRTRSLEKKNLLIFLTPNIIRAEADLRRESIRKRLQYERDLDEEFDFDELDDILPEDQIGGESKEKYALVRKLNDLSGRYPIEQMRAIEQARVDQRAAATEAASAPDPNRIRYAIRVQIFDDESAATDALTELLDRGYDGTLVTEDSDGTLLYRVLIGPIDELDDAERKVEVLRESFDYSPSIIILSGESDQ